MNITDHITELYLEFRQMPEISEDTKLIIEWDRQRIIIRDIYTVEILHSTEAYSEDDIVPTKALTVTVEDPETGDVTTIFESSWVEDDVSHTRWEREEFEDTLPYDHGTVTLVHYCSTALSAIENDWTERKDALLR